MSSAHKTKVVLVTADAAFAASASATFGASNAIELVVIAESVTASADAVDAAGATVVVVDLDPARDQELAGLTRLIARVDAPVIAVTQGFDASVARTLLQMRVADFLVKPVAPIDLVRACAQASRRPAAASAEPTEATIHTFLPAVGGAGVTTLAVQSAMLLLNSGGARGKPSTCLVDLDFQHGAVADYLDIEPRLNIAEIEPRPDRLDRQLLEIMLTYHPSGLAVVAAPNRPAEMRTFDPDMVTRLLDLVSTNFDYVVFDTPRTWFSWTDSVLLGSNKLFIVSEATVPGLRHATQLVARGQFSLSGTLMRSRRSRSGSAKGRSRRSSSTGSIRSCSPPRSLSKTFSNPSVTPSPQQSRTITIWCARRLIVACRWKT